MIERSEEEAKRIRENIKQLDISELLSLFHSTPNDFDLKSNYWLLYDEIISRVKKGER